MDRSLVFVVCAAFVIAVCARTPTIKVAVTTKYVTTEVQTVEQDTSIVLIGNLCGDSRGMAVNISVMLNNNPDWEPAFGTLLYYVVDSPEKTKASALCTNLDGTHHGPLCLISSWPSTNDIYIKGTGNQVSATSFSVESKFVPAASDEAAAIRAKAQKPESNHVDSFSAPEDVTTVYLTQIVMLATTQRLQYKWKALLNFTFCATPSTGSRYEIQSTVTGIDGQSSYTLYICSDVPCEVDSINIIAHNGRQLPSNTVTTSSGQWHNLYAYIICWGGVYDPTDGNYTGTFVFNAHQKNAQ